MPQPCEKVKKKPYGIIIPQGQSPVWGIFFTKSNEHPSAHSAAEIKSAKSNYKALVIPAQAGIHCVLLNFETGWNTIAPDLVSPKKIVIPAQAGIGTLNRAQRAPIKYF